MKARDVILAVDGAPLPRLKPDRVVVGFLEREVARRAPGQTLKLTVLRGETRLDLPVVLGEEPRLTTEADRKYFDRIGLTAREFVYADAVALRVKTSSLAGVMAHFVKPNGPAAIAGLRTDDWIKEIDGTEVGNFAAAAQKLGAIEADAQRAEFVLLVGRGNETAVLRVKFRHLDSWTAGRQRNATLYQNTLAAMRLPIQLPYAAPWQTRHIWHQFVIRAEQRDGLQAWLREQGIGTSVYYPLPLHLQPCFQYLGYTQGAFPVSEQAALSVLALPVYPELTESEIMTVCHAIEQFYARR